MPRNSTAYPIALSILCTMAACFAPERHNPLDASGTAQPSAVRVEIPFAKALAVVVSRVEAILEGPNTEPISKDLLLTPLGPAKGVITTLKPGDNYKLTLKGYDTAGDALFEGNYDGFSIAEGETTHVEIRLVLVREIPSPSKKKSGLNETANSNFAKVGEG